MSAHRTLESERVVISAPLSFTGSSQRIWKITARNNTAAVIACATLAIVLIVLAWTMVFAWYLMFGLLLVPYRVIRRGDRKRRREDLQHRETLAAIEASRHQH